MYCYSATSLDGWRMLSWLASLSAVCWLLSVGSLSQSTGSGVGLVRDRTVLLQYDSAGPRGTERLPGKLSFRTDRRMR